MAIATIKIFGYILVSDASFFIDRSKPRREKKDAKKNQKKEFSICLKSVLKQDLVNKLQGNL